MSAAALGCFGALLLASSGVFAQTLPEGLLRGQSATSGRQDVARSGFEAPIALPEDEKDTTELKLSAGGLLTGGNSRTLALTAASRFRIRRGDNQLASAAAANYGSAAPEGSREREVTVENVQGMLRYDRFVSDAIAALVSMSVLRDRFQGLAMRLNLDPGFAYYFLDDPKHRFWTELGYDLQHDLRTDAAIAAAPPEKPLERSEVRHSLRILGGYENDLSETLAIHAGVEYLQALVETENFRINATLGLTSKIRGNFSIATSLYLRFDNNPLPGFARTDYTSALSLVYQLL